MRKMRSMNTTKMALGLKKFSVAIGLIALSACSSESDAPRDWIYGTFAAGAPIAGEIYLKDAKGKVQTARSDQNGHFQIFVSYLTPPLVLEGIGNIGTREFILHAPVVSADFNHTVNITPITDLIVANIAGGNPTNFYTAGDFSGINAEVIQAQENIVQTRFSDMLLDLQQPLALDLLHTPFKADHTGIDAMLDILAISYDDTNKKALIKNILDDTRIEDDLANLSDAAVLPQKGGILAKVNDLNAIVANVDLLGRQFASSAPNVDSSELKGLFTQNFMHSTQNMADFIAGLIAIIAPSVNAPAAEFSVSRVVFLDIAAGQAVIEIDIFKNDQTQSYVLPMLREGNQWKFHGDQKLVKMELSALISSSSTFDLTNSNTPSTLTKTVNLQYFFDNADARNVSMNIVEVQINGPGLSTSGLKLTDCSETDATQTNLEFYHNCTNRSNYVQITQIPQSDNGYLEYTVTIVKRDGTSTSFNLSLAAFIDPATIPDTDFPQLTAPKANALKNYNGGDIAIKGTIPNTLIPEYISVASYYVNSANFSSAVSILLPTTFAIDETLTLPSNGQNTTDLVSEVVIEIFAKDKADRLFLHSSAFNIRN